MRATAAQGGADTLVTFNITDFPSGSVEDYGIEVVHPDQFLVRLLAERHVRGQRRVAKRGHQH